MRIVQLEAENVKRLQAVTITPDGNLVVVGGRNAQGKSSVLDSIFMALAGKKAQGAKPVREGADKAKIILDLGDLVVTRTITKEGGGTIKVANKEGAVFQSPQGMLDALCSKLTFDPLAFMREKPVTQRDMLQRLVGLDFSAQDAQRMAVFTERTDVNRRGKDAKARLDAMPTHPDAPAEAVSVSGLMAELDAAEVHNRNREAMEKDVMANIQALHEIRDALDDEAELYAPILDAVKEHINGALNALDDLALPVIRDTSDLRRSINEADAINRQVRENEAHAELSRILDGLRKQSEGLTNKINDIDIQKAEAMTAAKFPVSGLAFDADGITLDGIPFEQCSSAEQLRVSVAMGLAMNPKLKILLIKDGSLLDDDNLRMVAEMAAEADAQVWVERVGKGKECSVIIEDGVVSLPLSEEAA